VDVDGAVVIVGVTARSQQDYHPTPYANNYWRYLYAEGGGLMSGAELHAHVYATLYDRAYISTQHWLSSLPVLLLAGALLGRVFACLNLGWGFVVAFAFHWGWKGLCFAAFTAFHWRVEMVGMLLLGALTYLATFALRWWVLRRMLGVVKSTAVARMLENDPRHLGGRGEDRVVTVMFADVRDFTTFSEQHAAREVVALLNAYFAAVVPLIEKEGGTLLQYMGDGIMVLFGAPEPCADHAVRAVRAAVAMLRRVHELGATWARLGNPELRIGVGIHTGQVALGTIGAPRRLDYTAIGDTVNTAARIEGENKTFRTEILVSAETYRELPWDERKALGCVEEPQTAKVKGKGDVVLLHAVDWRSAPTAGATPAPPGQAIRGGRP
jgi:adenylate cyclase